MLKVWTLFCFSLFMVLVFSYEDNEIDSVGVMKKSNLPEIKDGVKLHNIRIP